MVGKNVLSNRVFNVFFSKKIALFIIRMLPLASNSVSAFPTKNLNTRILLGLILFCGSSDKSILSLIWEAFIFISSNFCEKLREVQPNENKFVSSRVFRYFKLLFPTYKVLLSRPGTWEIPNDIWGIPNDIQKLLEKIKKLLKEFKLKELIELLKKLLEEALGKGLAHELYFILFFLIYVLYLQLMIAYNVEFLRNYVFVLYWCFSFLEGFYGGTFFKNRKAAIRKRPLLVDRTSTKLHMWLRRKFPKFNRLILKLEAKWFFFKNRKMLKKLQDSTLQFPFPFMTE